MTRPTSLYHLLRHTSSRDVDIQEKAIARCPRSSPLMIRILLLERRGPIPVLGLSIGVKVDWQIGTPTQFSGPSRLLSRTRKPNRPALNSGLSHLCRFGCFTTTAQRCNRAFFP